MKNETEAIKGNKKNYQSWSKRIRKNDTTEEIEVCEAENGFIVTHTISGYTKSKDGGKDWFDKTKKYVSKENPLEDEEAKSFAESLSDVLENLDEGDGSINVK